MGGPLPLRAQEEDGARSLLAVALAKDRLEGSGHVANDGGPGSIERRTNGEHDPEVRLCTTGLLGHDGHEVANVVGDDRAAVLLRAPEELVVGDSAVAARELGSAHDVVAARAKLSSDLTRPHLVQDKLHMVPARSLSVSSSSAEMRASISSGCSV